MAGTETEVLERDTIGGCDRSSLNVCFSQVPH